MMQSDLLAEVCHQNSEPVTSLAVDESGSTVISGDQRGHVTVWAISTSSLLHRPCQSKVTEVSHCVYTPCPEKEHRLTN